MTPKRRSFLVGFAPILCAGLLLACGDASVGPPGDGDLGEDPDDDEVPGDTTTTPDPPSDPLSLAQSTFLGGGRFDHIRDAVVGPDGSIYVTGRTASTNFCPGAGVLQASYGGGPFDAFVARLSGDLKQVVWCTYFGGSAYDVGYGIGLDDSGNIYIGGRTSSTDLPTTQGAFDRTYNGGRANLSPYFGGDAFAAKISPDGRTLLYGTYFGGSLDDLARNMTVDPATGSVHLVGRTESTDLPIPQGSIQRTFGGGSHDAWVAKLTPDGSGLVYATYLGGNDNERGEGIALDAAGVAYATGATESSDFPGTAGAVRLGPRGGLDIWVASISQDGATLRYSAVFGGSDNDAPEQAALVVDGAGRAWVSGYSRSSDFPTTQGAYRTRLGGDIDGIVLSLSSDGGTLLASTYLGGPSTCWETAFGPPGVDGDGNVFVTGGTACDDFPVTSEGFQAQRAGEQDAFVVEFSPDLAEMLFASYLGGGDIDGARGLVRAATGEVYVYGQSGSANLPGLGSGAQSGYGGSIDAFLSLVR